MYGALFTRNGCRTSGFASSASPVSVKSPTHPLMRVVDLERLADVRRPRGIHAVIGNTFATPVLQNPLALGIDPDAFLARLRVVSPAISPGGVESTVCQPARTSHARLTGPQRAELGIDDRLMRFSTGIEGVDDLVADLDETLG